MVQLNTVHPHACGDYGGRRGIVRPLEGSPPRVWGLHEGDAEWMREKRFTPTRVGTTGSRVCISTRSPVHPHACGDYFILGAFSFTAFGSPPRVWGLLNHYPGNGEFIRFTPTRVGTTSFRSFRCKWPSVHPHACGDYAEVVVKPEFVAGSPPRVWGLRWRISIVRRTIRFTPTRVGTTNSFRTLPS